jgi:hypothetical protein
MSAVGNRGARLPWGSHGILWWCTGAHRSATGALPTVEFATMRLPWRSYAVPMAIWGCHGRPQIDCFRLTGAWNVRDQPVTRGHPAARSFRRHPRSEIQPRGGYHGASGPQPGDAMRRPTVSGGLQWRVGPSTRCRLQPSHGDRHAVRRGRHAPCMRCTCRACARLTCVSTAALRRLYGRLRRSTVTPRHFAASTAPDPGSGTPASSLSPWDNCGRCRVDGPVRRRGPSQRGARQPSGQRPHNSPRRSQVISRRVVASNRPCTRYRGGLMPPRRLFPPNPGKPRRTPKNPEEPRNAPKRPD